MYGANLAKIKEDFFAKLLPAKNEIAGLYKHLLEGKINGSVYTGECACLVGTIANIRKEPYNALQIKLTPDSTSPAERWFLGIQKGDTPENNQISAITAKWIKEFAAANGVQL